MFMVHVTLSADPRIFLLCACVCFRWRGLSTYIDTNSEVYLCIFTTSCFIMAQPLRIVSWNTRGLNAPQKRSLVFSVLKKCHPHIICLQETHLTGSKVRALKRPWLSKLYHATHTNYSRGVSILLAKSLPAELISVKTDPEGRYIVLILRISTIIFTLVNVYVPPPFSVEVLSKLSLHLLNRPLGPLLYIGDFNAVLDPTVDRLGGEADLFPPL